MKALTLNSYLIGISGKIKLRREHKEVSQLALGIPLTRWKQKLDLELKLKSTSSINSPSPPSLMYPFYHQLPISDSPENLWTSGPQVYKFPFSKSSPYSSTNFFHSPNSFNFFYPNTCKKIEKPCYKTSDALLQMSFIHSSIHFCIYSFNFFTKCYWAPLLCQVLFRPCCYNGI